MKLYGQANSAVGVRNKKERRWFGKAMTTATTATWAKGNDGDRKGGDGGIQEMKDT